MMYIKPCCICQDNEKYPPHPLYSIPGKLVVECPHCGLVYVNGTFQEEIIEHYGGHEDIYELNREIFDRTFINRLKKIERLKKTNGKTVLDVECGFGYFLNVAKQHGWVCYGVDISRYAAEFAKKQFDIQIQVASVHSAEFPKEFFDVVTMFNILEHLSEPVHSLQQIADWIKPDGLLVIETPSEDSLIHSFHRFIYKLSMGKITYANTMYGTKYGHWYVFNKKNIRMILEKMGFSIRHIEQIESPFRILLAKNNLKKSLPKK
ncbi:MAG: class I SAM-dependent methyltransferase [bacterium]|nr:class I SAM-dependent methyltransferase [bacterium]